MHSQKRRKIVIVPNFSPYLHPHDSTLCTHEANALPSICSNFATTHPKN